MKANLVKALILVSIFYSVIGFFIPKYFGSIYEGLGFVTNASVFLIIINTASFVLAIADRSLFTSILLCLNLALDIKLFLGCCDSIGDQYEHSVADVSVGLIFITLIASGAIIFNTIYLWKNIRSRGNKTT